MNLQSVAFTGADALAMTLFALRSPVTVNGRSVFRRVFGLRISSGGLADGIRFAAAASHLALTFGANDNFDVRAAGIANVQAKGGSTLIVELPAPVRVRGAHLTGGVTSDAFTIDLFRMDGDELAGDPTKSFTNNGNVSGDFTDRRFALRLRKQDGSFVAITPANLTQLRVLGLPTAARAGLAPAGQDPASALFFFNLPGVVGQNTNSPSGNADIGAPLAAALEQQIGALEPPFPDPLDLLLVVESDAPCQLQVNSFALPLTLERTHFRALLLRAEDVTDPVAFLTRLHDGSAPLTAYLRSHLAPPTLAAIERTIGGRAPARVIEAVARDLNSLLQADAVYAATRFQGISLTPETLAAAQAGATGTRRTRLNRTLLEEAFPGVLAPIPPSGSDEKETLRAQGATATLEVHVELPRAALISAATLRMEASLRGDAPGGARGEDGADAGEDGGGANGGEWQASIPDTTGVAANATRAVARRFQPEAALHASGMALALAGIAPSNELTAEIRAEEGGAPTGRTVASGKVVLEALDDPAWVHFPFAAAAVLQAKPYWIVLRATQGAVLWLADQQPAITRVGDPAPRGWTDRGGFSDIAPLHQIWERGAAPRAVAGDGGSGSSGQDLSGRLRVKIGDMILTPLPAQGRAVTVDITAALASWLAAQPASPPIVTVPIAIAALGKGTVTVYPPEIRYSL